MLGTTERNVTLFGNNGDRGLSFPYPSYDFSIALREGLPSGSGSKVSACNAGDLGSIPGLGRSPLEKGIATHSSILAWRIPWTKEPDWLQSTGSQRVRHNWAINTAFLGDMLNSQEGLCKLQPTHSFWLLLFVNQVYGNTATPTSLHITEGALPLQRQRWGFGTETIRPKTLITWSFQEKAGDSWAREKLVKHWSWSALGV